MSESYFYQVFKVASGQLYFFYVKNYIFTMSDQTVHKVDKFRNIGISALHIQSEIMTSYKTAKMGNILLCNLVLKIVLYSE